MTHMTLSAFLDIARRDAALQERVQMALGATNPQEAVVALAHSRGIALSATDLAAAFSGELGEDALEAVAGGGFTPTEFFSEFKTTAPKDGITPKIAPK